MTNKEALMAWKKLYSEIDKENWLFVGTINPEMVDLAIKALEQESKTDILEKIIAEINTSNRGTCDYYIVDRIEEIINEYQKGGAEE